MFKILEPMNSFAVSYYDDVIIFSKQKDHFNHLQTVLKALYDAGLKLNKEKCQFFVSVVNFLGYNITKNSIKASPRKIDTISNYPVPKSAKDVKKFLGLAGSYRKLIPDYSCIASPLNALLTKNALFDWTNNCQNAFVKLKNSLCNDPVLKISNPDWQYIVKVDSSKCGAGCILEQIDPETNDRFVVEYASCKYNDTQRNYPSIELEVCGLIFAVKHWKHYLIGKPFIVETDSKAVQWIKGKRDTLGKLGRWSLFLENFEFETVHVKGKDHCASDALSRIHEINSVENNVSCVNDLFCKLPDFINLEQWFQEITNDVKLMAMMNNVICVINDTYVKNDNHDIYVVPESARLCVLEYLHKNFGHLGTHKLLYRVKERFFWPGLNKDVTNFCKQCHECAINKDNRPPNSAPLVPIDTSMLEPFQKTAIDILGPLPEASDGSKYVVILQDYFTKWPEAIAMKNVTSENIRQWLLTDIIPKYGVPNELITDQGVQFVAESFKSFCLSVGIKQRFTSPFHPQTDGMVEKFNRTFLNMLRNYVSEFQTDWPNHIPLIMFAYRTAVNDTINVSPAEALQGRKLKLPIDVIIPPNIAPQSNSLDKLFEKFEINRSIIRENSKKALVKREKDYNNDKNRCIKETFQPKDLVYWKKPVPKKGRSPELSPIWQGPFSIKCQLSDVNYILCDDKNNNVTVHVNNLKLCRDKNVQAKQIRTRGRPKKQ